MKKATALMLMLPFAAFPAMAKENPYTAPDDTWISLSGTAVETSPKSFTLDYGEGTIQVETDDWQRYETDMAALLEGDKVTVYGEVDDDFAETAKIEANSVYIESLDQYFYASAADEETNWRYTITTPIVVGDAELIGTVTSVSDKEFTVDTGVQQITVDTSALPRNPLDEYGFQQIEKGDLVRVNGDMEDDLIETMELLADSVVVLEEGNA